MPYKMNKLYLVFGLLLCSTICNAKEYTETIWTADEDCIIISYNIQYQGDKAKITFLNVETSLNRQNSRRYRKPEYIKVTFFDKVERYNNIVFSGITPQAIAVPSNLRYTKSSKGYFFVEDNPTISFTIVGEEAQKLYIPLYLTYYEGRSEREIFSGCSNFYILVDPSALANTDSDTDTSISSYQSSNLKSVAIPDNGADSEGAEKVYEQIELVMELLDEQTKLPFSDGLIFEVGCLRQMKRDVEDKQLSRAIQKCLEEYDIKKAEMEAAAEMEVQNAKREAERKELEKQQQLQAEQERKEEEQRKLAEEEKKRSLWMTIGGIILAAVCFIGNQILQHFRNLRNQRSMLEIQQDITRRAEAEAKRHAQNYTRRKVSDVVNSTKRGTQDIVRNKVRQTGGNKSKKISI